MTPISHDGLRTGEVAERTGVNIQTLRYYERRGLITEPGRSAGGHRTYPPDTVGLIGVIKAGPRTTAVRGPRHPFSGFSGSRAQMDDPA